MWVARIEISKIFTNSSSKITQNRRFFQENRMNLILFNKTDLLKTITNFNFVISTKHTTIIIRLHLKNQKNVLLNKSSIKFYFYFGRSHFSNQKNACEDEKRNGFGISSNKKSHKSKKMEKKKLETKLICRRAHLSTTVTAAAIAPLKWLLNICIFFIHHLFGIQYPALVLGYFTVVK